MRKSQFSEDQIIRVLDQVQSREKGKGVCHEPGISEGTSYRWKAKYGGLEISEVRRVACDLVRDRYGLGERRACALCWSARAEG